MVNMGSGIPSTGIGTKIIIHITSLVAKKLPAEVIGVF
jgi:hypothetical protein